MSVTTPEPSSIAPISVGVFAHNEEARIEAALHALPLDDTDYDIAVIINGATDETAVKARAVLAGRPGARVLEYAEGGKARSWNRFVHEDATPDREAYAFTDGDLRLAPGALAAMRAALKADAHANAVSAPPLAGRKADAYRAQMARDRTLFGGLYLLRGAFLERVRAQNCRMPIDVIGEDGMVESWVKTDLGRDADWDQSRVAFCPDAGFYSEHRSIARMSDLIDQWRRLVRYSERRLQNKAITMVMGSDGVSGLPEQITPLAAANATLSDVRLHPLYMAPDLFALRRLKERAEAL
ncbi:MAG: glycosyltransferase [Pseudomonadota bacterium]